LRRDQNFFPLRWTVTQLEKGTGGRIGDELPARVPGDVFTDLWSAGKIPDPYLGLNSEQVQWVNQYDWLYRGAAELAPAVLERLWIEFQGLDYRYAIGWNGRELFQGEGMFSRRLFEVAPVLPGTNAIEVRFSGLPDRWVESKLPPVIFNTEPVRRKYLKTQMSFGWDFAPRLKGCGVWDEAALFATGPALIRDALVRTGNDGTVDLEFELDSGGEIEALLELTIAGETFAGEKWKASVPVRLEKGPRNLIRHRLHVEQPRLWWPWDQGRPELYRLSAAVMVGGKRSDAVTEVFGFREIGWTRNPGSPQRALDWTLLVNGRRVFLRGANFVPAESMAGRLTGERYRKLVELARDANLNALRLWGGGNRERRDFYDACDRLGVLVWQEFPVACVNFRLPRSKKYSRLLQAECMEIARQLRNHPSLMMWCGGNEFNARWNQPAIETMKQVCHDLDPTRRFVPASPHRGDAHNWLVWHLKGNLTDYFADRSQLVSEFGLQAPPALESLREFLPGDLLWPIGRGWTHHHLGRGKMEKYVRSFGAGAGLENFVHAGQEAQAHYLHRGIERWRRAKYEKSGAFLWQWNEPWPCVSWSVVDYYLRPKRGYEAVKLAFQPLLVSAEFEQKSYQPGELFSALIFLVNDLPRDFPEVEVEVWSGGERMQTLRGAVDRDQVSSLGEISFRLPAAAPPMLELTAREAGQEISRNCYHLAFHDPTPASFIGRRLFKRWWQFLSE
jgi:beta-mannosidase